MRTTCCLAAVLAAATAGLTAVAAAQSTTGNGALSGQHYSLNIIGVSHDKSTNPDWASGHVIFVDLGRKDLEVTTKILLGLSPTGTFDVLDKNGTDGEASFSLPAPGTYTVYARALGTPGGKAKITTCATDDPGRSRFRNVTDALTTIVLDPVANAAAVTACGATTVSLFDPCLQGFFWQYDNNGLKILQVRFYPNPS